LRACNIIIRIHESPIIISRDWAIKEIGCQISFDKEEKNEFFFLKKKNKIEEIK